MKSMIKGMIVFFSVLLISLIALMIYALVGGTDELPMFGGLINGFDRGRLINTQEVDLKDITDISIKTSSSDVYFMASDSEELVIKEYTGNKTVKNSFVTSNKTGSELNIKSDDKVFRSWIVFGSNYGYIEIFIPESYHGSLNIDTDSGDIYTDVNFELDDYVINTSSGDVNVEEIYAETILIKTSSGDVCAEVLSGQGKIATQSGEVNILSGTSDMEISTSSGDVQLDDGNGSIKVDTQSGDVTMRNLMGGAKVKTSSGEIYLSVDQLKSGLDLKSESGDISCHLAQDEQFQFQADTISGDIVTYFDEQLSFNRQGTRAEGTIGDTTDCLITIKTSSGDIDFLTK